MKYLLALLTVSSSLFATIDTNGWEFEATAIEVPDIQKAVTDLSHANLRIPFQVVAYSNTGAIIAQAHSAAFKFNEDEKQMLKEYSSQHPSFKIRDKNTEANLVFIAQDGEFLDPEISVEIATGKKH